AAHMLDIMQGKANKFPLPAPRIDMTGLEAWRVWCAANHRSNNNIIDTQGTMFGARQAVAAMGRASFTMKDGLYSILQDLPQTTPIQHFTPRNSWGFKATFAFPILPGMLKVRFVNPGANYQNDERWVFDDGYTSATPDLVTEVLDLTHGCTDPDEAWRDGRYHLAQARLRPEIYEILVDFENLVCTRGDFVLVSHDIIQAGLGAGRVKTMQLDGSGNCTGVTTDEFFTFSYGNSYVLRTRRSGDGTSLLNALVNPVGGVSGIDDLTDIDSLTDIDTIGSGSGSVFTNVLVFVTPIPAANPQPTAGDLVMLGLVGSEPLPMIVTRITPGKDLIATLQLQDYVPAIYTSDSGTPPPFNYGPPSGGPPTSGPPVSGQPTTLAQLAAAAASISTLVPVIKSVTSTDVAMPKNAGGGRELLISVALQSPTNPLTGGMIPAAKFSGIEVQI